MTDPPLTLTPGGSAVGVLGEAAAGGGAPAPEQSWLSDRDFNGEVVMQHVARGLLLGRDVGKGRIGRNLLTEAEHQAHARAGRDLLDQGASKPGEKRDTAAELARRGADDAGVAYLRDNADSLLDETAAKQAKAAQTLLDSYAKLAPLRHEPAELDELIPDAPLEQARWVTRARDEVTKDLGALPSGLAQAAREKLSELAEGDDPSRWFVGASELSDELLRARTRAARADQPPEVLDVIDRAKSRLDEGLASELLWGKAARDEGQRSAGYARRYGDHIEAFEAAFTADLGDGKRAVDPAAFRALMEDSADPLQAETLARTLESARATADVAARYGRKDEAAAITRSIAALERTGRQARAIAAARGVSRGTDQDPTAAALEWLSRPEDPALAGLGGAHASRELLETATTGETTASAEAAAQRLAARGGVFRATATLAQVARASSRAGVERLLSAPDELDDDPDTIAPAQPEGLSLEDYDAHRDHIDKMARDPEYFAEVMASGFGSLPEAAPEVYRELSTQAAKTVQYLAAIAPGGSTGGPFAERIPVSEDDLWEYNERLSAVAEPEHIRRELAAGRLSAQSIAAFEVMHPAQYAQLQRDVFERLQALKAQGIPVTIQAREQLDTLLNLDGGGEPGLTWKVAERAYAAQQRKAASASAIDGGSGEHASAMQSGALATLGNGASAIAQTG